VINGVVRSHRIKLKLGLKCPKFPRLWLPPHEVRDTYRYNKDEPKRREFSSIAAAVDARGRPRESLHAPRQAGVRRRGNQAGDNSTLDLPYAGA